MSYISIPPGSNSLVVGTSSAIYSLDVTTGEAHVVVTLGGDVRGVFSPKDNLYFAADYAEGQIWRISYNPTTGATSSALIATGQVGARGLDTTASGDLIAAVAREGVWKYPGLGK